MARLPRPPIPLAIKLEVCLRQLGDDLDTRRAKVKQAKAGRRLGQVLRANLFVLACQIGCAVSDLDLDHNPALQNRKKIFRDGVHVDYTPRANDPEHLFWRPHGPQFDGSHKIKTLVRGEHGQYSDAAMARKNKKIARNRNPKRRTAKIAQRKNPWPKGRKIPSRKGRF